MAKILLVDDDPLQAFARKSLLGKRFKDVERAADAAEALCLLEQPQFAAKLGLVISGLHLPGISGPEFVAELHARQPGVPVIVLGNSQDEADDYGAEEVCFLPGTASSELVLSMASKLLQRAARS
ncbi:MAG: response regulator [Acidobacteriota bacterium]|nr:response regulator [Acidobacteriota bacterium]